MYCNGKGEMESEANLDISLMETAVLGGADDVGS